MELQIKLKNEQDADSWVGVFGCRNEYEMTRRGISDMYAQIGELPVGNIIKVNWDLFLNYGEYNDTFIYPFMVQKFIDIPYPLKSMCPTLTEKVSNLSDIDTLPYLNKQIPGIYTGDIAIDDPTSISFFQKYAHAMEYKYLKEISCSSHHTEYRRKRAVMTRPGRFFGKLGLKDTHKLEVITSHFRPHNAFILLEGEDIRKYYRSTRYTQQESTTLHSGCMGHSSCQKFLDIYVENTKMLVSFDQFDKIKGKAIFWPKLDTKNLGQIQFLDRIYGSDSFVHAVKRYARSQGWYHKTCQDYCSHGYVTTPEGKEISIQMTFPYPKRHQYLPFMDTMGWHDEKENLLNNYGVGDDLDGTSGNEIPTCSHCGEPTPYYNLNSTDEGQVCNSCFDELYTTCDCCGYNKRDTQLTGGLNVCPTCIRRYYSTCDGCGEVTRLADMSKKHDQHVCAKCHEEDAVVICMNCRNLVPFSTLGYSGSTGRYCNLCKEEKIAKILAEEKKRNEQEKSETTEERLRRTVSEQREEGVYNSQYLYNPAIGIDWGNGTITHLSNGDRIQIREAEEEGT